MKLHEWGLLLLAYVLLLLIGAASFYFLERDHEAEQVQRLIQLRSDIQSEGNGDRVGKRGKSEGNGDRVGKRGQSREMGTE